MNHQILQIVCDHYHISLCDIKRRSRKPRYVQPRFVACYLLHKYAEINYRQIVELLYPYLDPSTNHATPIHAQKAIEACLSLQDWIYRDVQIVEGKVQRLIYQLKKAS